jgi:protease IV
MNEQPDTPEPEQTPPPTQQAAPPPRGPLPPPVPRNGWYNGPFPPPGWNGRESIGRSLLRAFGVAAVSVVTIMFGFFVVGGFLMVMFIAFAAVAGSGFDTAVDTGEVSTSHVYGDEDSRNKLLLIQVKGIILGQKDEDTGWFESLAGITHGYQVKRELEKAAKDSSIDGVILEMDTPGGTIFGSAAIGDGVREYREKTGKPVLAHVAGMSASGGMWAMVPATKVLADRGTLIGSIGVIMGPFAYYDGVTATEGGLLGGGVTTRNGIEYTTITAGRGKDMGSRYRRLTDEERAVLQKSVDTSYNAFVRHVAASRNIDEAKIRNQIGALIYDEESARELGLIDGTANRQEAFAEAARMADLPGEDWQVVRRRSESGLWGSLFARFQGDKPKAAASAKQATPCFAPHAVLAYYGDVAALCKGE